MKSGGFVSRRNTRIHNGQIQAGGIYDINVGSYGSFTIVSNGKTLLNSSGWLNDTEIDEGNRIYIGGGGKANNITVSKGGCFGIGGGASVSYINFLDTDGSHAFDLDVYSETNISGYNAQVGSDFSIINKIASNIQIYGGEVKVYSGCSMIDTFFLRHGGVVSVYQGGYVSKIVTRDCVMNQSCSCIVAGIVSDFYGAGVHLTISRNGIIDKVSGTDKIIVCSAGGRITNASNNTGINLKPSAYASTVDVASGKSLTVSSGATALDVVSQTGAIITVLNGGYIQYRA